MTETIVQMIFHVGGYVLCAVGMAYAVYEHVRWKKQIQRELIEKRRAETEEVEREIYAYYEQRFMAEIDGVCHGDEVAI